MLSRLLLLCVFATPVAADDTTEFLKASNWKGLEKYWKLDSEKKTITGITEVDPKFNTFLCSTAEYGDFELKFKVKLKNAIGNSGVQIRSALVDKEKFVVAGPQVDIGSSGKTLYWGSLYGEKVGGMMKAVSPEDVKAAKPDDWNNYTIIAKGDHITVTMNGVNTVDADFPKLPLEKGAKEAKPLAKTGIIAWQLHAGPPMTVEFAEIQFTKK